MNSIGIFNDCLSLRKREMVSYLVKMVQLEHDIAKYHDKKSKTDILECVLCGHEHTYTRSNKSKHINTKIHKDNLKKVRKFTLFALDNNPPIPLIIGNDKKEDIAVKKNKITIHNI